ncbi:MAG: DNA topoisomerase IV subunit B [Alphaproteobacteria bacterium]|nr:DNA topoisomerase IV subunit B [Alphaproteobacteria bacterium]
MSDLFSDISSSKTSFVEAKPTEEYSAKDIEVLEGLEPVRRRPGMYIGGTDDTAYHHMAAEILDNAMDETVAGFATVIEVELLADGSFRVKDNGRGIPVDPHPKYPDKSALEVIMTSLHSGGKFGGKAYNVSGGLHGVGAAVVNALSSEMIVEVAREKTLWRQSYSRGVPTSILENLGTVANRRGTTVIFKPDTEIFGEEQKFRPAVLYRMARTKAFLFKGVEIRWKCDASLLTEEDKIPTEEIFKYPNGLEDFLNFKIKDAVQVSSKPFSGRTDLSDGSGYIEWAITWLEDGAKGFVHSFCNTIRTSQGGTHETGLRTALTRSIRSYAEMLNKKSDEITADDVVGGAGIVFSLFMKEPQFQGQTKERLGSPEATRLVDSAIKDQFDHWLSADTKNATNVLSYIQERSQQRIELKKMAETVRSKGTGKHSRLPGKLADCSHSSIADTELFIVEGDSAGGSAKQARDRKTQAILPIRGKILNVAKASQAAIMGCEEVNNILEALGSGRRDQYNEEKLRYNKIIIMTDADVDGAHITILLMTLFYRETPQLIENGHLYLAVPPLYCIKYKDKRYYAIDDADKDALLKKLKKTPDQVEISRFKGLGEMNPKELKDTTMDKNTRILIRVKVPDKSVEEEQDDVKLTSEFLEKLMGDHAEMHFQYIKEHAKFVDDIDL